MDAYDQILTAMSADPSWTGWATGIAAVVGFLAGIAGVLIGSVDVNPDGPSKGDWVAMALLGPLVAAALGAGANMGVRADGWFVDDAKVTTIVAEYVYAEYDLIGIAPGHRWGNEVTFTAADKDGEHFDVTVTWESEREYESLVEGVEVPTDESPLKVTIEPAQ